MSRYRFEIPTRAPDGSPYVLAVGVDDVAFDPSIGSRPHCFAQIHGPGSEHDDIALLWEVEVLTVPELVAELRQNPVLPRGWEGWVSLLLPLLQARLDEYAST